METLEMSNSNDNNRWRFELPGLTPENIDQVYKRELALWRVFHSDSRLLDGVEISTEKFMFMYIGNGFNDIDPKRFEVNNVCDGFPLKEETFIKEKISHYEYILKDTEGSVLDRTVHLKCEIFLKYLKKKLVSLSKEFSEYEMSKEAPLNLPQIALLFYYEGGGISKENCNATAEEYGWVSKTSGHKLYQHFNRLSNNTERVGDPGSKVKLKNKIRLLESVVEHLSHSATQQAKKEIDHLKRLFKDHY